MCPVTYIQELNVLLEQPVCMLTILTVPLKCNVVSQEYEQFKNLLMKGSGTHFACEYSSHFVWDKYLQVI